MENKTPNVIPACGELAVIRIVDGTLEIWNGNINKQHDDVYLIEECTVENGEVNIKGKHITWLRIDEKVTEHEGSFKVGKEVLTYNDILKVVENPEEAIQVHEVKRNWFTKLLGYKDIKFNYIVLEDASMSNYYNKRKLLLKQDHWVSKEFKTNLYIFQRI